MWSLISGHEHEKCCQEYTMALFFALYGLVINQNIHFLCQEAKSTAEFRHFTIFLKIFNGFESPVKIFEILTVAS